ncbi:MAG: PQQ-binding-like beta-propeller repeat protein [Verrucomicrobiales bacterium]|nr:PQQ-binding-like beta-propeller repeat protein [Verrucomicrobiales bacterium]
MISLFLTSPQNRFRVLMASLVIAVLSVGSISLRAQDRTLSPEQFEDASLQYRTALHYDPLLPQPLDGLVKLYREGDRIEELIGLYRSHVEQYPDDAGAKSVLIQILNREKREDAGELVTAAVAIHPKFSALQYLLFQFLEGKGDARAFDALSRAIDLEPNVARRGKWLEELLQLSEGDEARKLAGVQLERLLTVEGQSADDLLNLAKLMQRYLFWDLSMDALNQAISSGLSPESGVEAQVMRAKAFLELGKGRSAASVLDDLLSKLSANHWRRRELLSMRISVVAEGEERDAIIETFRENYLRSPDSETAALDYAEMLVASERQSEATKVLLAAASHLPSSVTIENRALELISSGSNPEALEAFLQERLEIDPERADLRFQLVKVRYSLGKDAEAEQDFKGVVAGLEPAQLSDRILELQRYLRGIDRIDAASIYLQRYVRNYPARLDVARELAEVYVSRDERKAIDPLINSLNVIEAPVETLGDLALFLTEEGFYASAKSILTKRLSADPAEFGLGLMLMEVLAELGDEEETSKTTSRVRELADTPERYAQWLDSAVTANTSLETLDRFFATEQNRFNFDENQWAEDKVEKFVILCEAGKLKLQVETMAASVRKQLDEGSFDASLRIRLRKFLVGMLESDPAASGEVEEQLKRLADEDVANRAEYDLQRALLYHRTQRIDLAQELLTTVAFSEIKSPGVLQESISVLVDYGFLKQAADALTAVNKLLPEDVFSWERRLTILATLNLESEFRAVIRQLRSGDAGLELRADSMALLDRHLQASFWRSISRLIATGEVSRFEETLPLLASVDREEQSLKHSAWTEWTRAIVLRTLGREEESIEASNRLDALLSGKKLEVIEFPDGLSLAAYGAKSLIDQTSPAGKKPSTIDAADLLSGARLRWAFEVDPGTQIEHFGQSGDYLLALDNRGKVYSIVAETGKLKWSETLSSIRASSDESRPAFLLRQPAATSADSSTESELSVKMVRPFLIGEDRFFLFHGDDLRSYSSAEGELLWSSSLVFSPLDPDTPSIGSRPDTLMEMSDGKLIVFRPDRGNLFAFDAQSGKRIWETRIWKEKPSGVLSSLNAGLDVNAGRVFAYGWQSVILDLETGKPFWEFDRSVGSTFPVTLRKERGEDPPAPAISEEAAGSEWQEKAADTVQINQLVDFTRGRFESSVISSLENRDLSMVSPAVYWARARLQEGTEAYGQLGDGFLWLMQDDILRRLSIRLPVASRQMKAGGTFVGVVKNHAWFLDGSTLRHLDFNTGRESSRDVDTLGTNLRVVLTGNQLIVRGPAGAVVINALTGIKLGEYVFPPELLAHLKEIAERQPFSTPSQSFWRGAVHEPGNGEPRYCIPIQDSITPNGFVTQFGGNVIACLRKEPLPETTKEKAAP